MCTAFSRLQNQHFCERSIGKVGNTMNIDFPFDVEGTGFFYWLTRFAICFLFMANAGNVGGGKVYVQHEYTAQSNRRYFTKNMCYMVFL